VCGKAGNFGVFMGGYEAICNNDFRPMTSFPNPPTTTARPHHLARTWLTARTTADWLYAGLVALAALIVFGLQAPNIGFYGPNHGWTSSHGLAIMAHATPANGFVGYALQYRNAAGEMSYKYFDRYPFFFSAGMGALLRMSDDRVLQMRIARNTMNVIYLATVGVAALLVHQLTGNRWRALAAALLAFSGYWLVFYKDMVHYDQPALFGNLLLLYAIARHRLGGVRWPVYAAGLVAVSLGRGYSSYMIIGLWALWAVVERFVSGSWAWRDAVLVGVITVAWGGALLGYNLYTESARRDVPLAQTSIVDSALRRLPVFGEKDQGRTVGKNVPPWPQFAAMQYERLIQWTVPVRTGADELPPALLPLGAVMWGAALVYAWRSSGAKRAVIALTAVWGTVWLAFMINLAHGHRYTMMYGVGLPLMAYTALLVWLPPRRWLTGIALVAAFGAFIYSQGIVRAELTNPATNRASYTDDYNRIAGRIDGEGRNVLVNVSDGECVIEDDYCFVLGFYLQDQYLTKDIDAADYVVTRLPYYHANPAFLPPGSDEALLLLTDPVTPENAHAYLFDVSAGQQRTLPDELRVMNRFGRDLTLQNWSLRDGVQVGPCQRVRVESWWLAERRLDANYSMQLALVNSSGTGVAAANSDLTLLPTAVWVPDMFHIDARYVTVPCDAAPGEYALVMSVYDPGAGASLTVQSADGTPQGDFLYLTTLFVAE
jgi:hypothetical protein